MLAIKTYIREEFCHEILRSIDRYGHFVRHVVIVRLGLKKKNTKITKIINKLLWRIATKRKKAMRSVEKK